MGVNILDMLDLIVLIDRCDCTQKLHKYQRFNINTKILNEVREILIP